MSLGGEIANIPVDDISCQKSPSDLRVSRRADESETEPIVMVVVSLELR
jgi:hypothetical protein